MIINEVFINFIFICLMQISLIAFKFLSTTDSILGLPSLELVWMVF